MEQSPAYAMQSYGVPLNTIMYRVMEACGGASLGMPESNPGCTQLWGKELQGVFLCGSHAFVTAVACLMAVAKRGLCVLMVLYQNDLL